MEISFKNTKWKPIVHNEFKKKQKTNWAHMILPCNFLV